jgi:hypothetical protein
MAHATMDHLATPKQSITILGTTDRGGFNPLRKLISGFCDPFIPKHDDERTFESAEDSPQLQRRVVSTAATTTTTTNVQSRTVELHTSDGKAATRFGKLEVTTMNDSGLSLPPAPDSKAPRTISELTIDSNVSEVHPEYNGPEVQVSKKLTRQRRQHALQVFFASLLFVVATVMVLHKLGYTSIADLHAPQTILVARNGWGTGWIRIFHKTSIESNGFEMLKLTKKNQASSDVPVDVNDDESLPAEDAKNEQMTAEQTSPSHDPDMAEGHSNTVAEDDDGNEPVAPDDESDEL